MTIYQFGVNVNTTTLPATTIELRDELGFLINTVSRPSLVTWRYTDANAIGAGNSTTADELVATASDDLIFWDWQTVNTTQVPEAARYFLPQANQTEAIDIFRLGDGNDILNLTFDRDVAGFLSYDLNATVYGGTGNDLMMSGGGNDSLYGEEGLDSLFGGAGNDVILVEGNFSEGLSEFAFGGSGNDTIYGGSGIDSLYGGTDSDRIYGGESNDQIYGGANDDTLYGGGGGSNLFGGDVLSGGAGNDTLYGGFGADNLDGDDGFLDRLYGEDGNDNLTDSDGFVLMSGGAGDDNMYSNFTTGWTAAGNLATVQGGGGSDTFSMGSLKDSLNLVIDMDDGSADTNDFVGLANVANSYNSVTATLGGGLDVYFGSRGGNGLRIDRVDGGSGNDTIYGGSGADTLYGGTGFLDYLVGGSDQDLADDGADAIYDSDGVAYVAGNGGDDLITIAFASNWVGAGGNASDIVTLNGNGGADSFVLSSANSALRLVIAADDGSADGNDVVNWSAVASSYDRISATMGGGDDNYIGTGPGGVGNLIDIVYGGLGNDTLSGGAGDDTLFGSTAANALADGNDTLFGRSGNDTLAGGYGVDTLDGGAGDDVVIFNADNVVVGDNTAQDYVQGWDGGSVTAQYSYNGRTVNWSFDTFEGSTGVDSLVGTSGNDILIANTNDLYIDGAAQSSGPGRLAGIEIVLLGAGADIFMANDPNGAAATGTVLTTALTVYGGDGADVVYTGSGDDRIVGDSSTAGNDVIEAGLGNDTVWGDLEGQPDSATGGRDTLYGGGGDDTLYGGADNDTMFGGAGADTIDAGTGDDTVADLDGAAQFYGGFGADTAVFGFSNASFQMTGSSGGNFGTDANDSVYVVRSGGVLSYDSISLTLGLGNDTFITQSGTGGNQIDRISGESGNDVISSWDGNDTISGGVGNDVLWGGSGGDTIYGGGDTDYIYGGAGANDYMYGGAGLDYYYWARTDGAGDQIFDQFREAGGMGGQAQNTLVVFPGFDATGAMPTGAGVFEADHLLTDNVGGDDMIQLVDIDGAGGTLWRLDVVSGAGAGSSVTFDQRDIDTIALWNNEPGVGQQVIQTYQWDADAQAYLYISG